MKTAYSTDRYLDMIREEEERHARYIKRLKKDLEQSRCKHENLKHVPFGVECPDCDLAEGTYP